MGRTLAVAEDIRTLDFDSLEPGIFSTIQDGGYTLTWIGFGDHQRVASAGGSNNQALKDSALNVFGAEVVISRTDGRCFYFHSLEASGVAVDLDAIRVTFDGGPGAEVQVIKPSNAGFVKHASASPGKLVRSISVNIVSVSTDLAVDNIRLEAAGTAAITFNHTPSGVFGSMAEGAYSLGWIGFGDHAKIADLGDSHEGVLMDSAVNPFGAEVVISRRDGRSFYFESLEAAGVARGADAIRVTFVRGIESGEEVQVIKPTTSEFATYNSTFPLRAVRQIRLNIVSTATDMAVDNLQLRVAPIDTIDFNNAPDGVLTSFSEECYALTWIGFGDHPAIEAIGGANRKVLKDSQVNQLGAEVVIARKDGRAFYFDSLDARGIAVGSDAIRVTYDGGAGAEVQVIKPTRAAFATYASQSPDKLVRRISVNIVSTSTDMLVDNIRLRVPPTSDLDFSEAAVGEFTALDAGEYSLTWIGFGDKQKVVSLPGAHGHALKDSTINSLGAEVLITRKDGRPFYFESLDASGAASGLDAIRVTYGSGAGAVVQVIKPNKAEFDTYDASLPATPVNRIAVNIVSTSTDMAVDNIRLRVASMETIRFEQAPLGEFTLLDESCFALGWIGFGDHPAIEDVGGAHGHVLKDSSVNVFGAEVVIARYDGKPFYLESIDASGLAKGADAIRVTYDGAPDVQVIKPTTADFATYASAFPARAVKRISLNIVSVSTDMAVDNVRLRLAPEQPLIVDIHRISANSVKVLFEAEPRTDVVYELQAATKLGSESDWINIQNPKTVAVGVGRFEASTSATAPERFFRIQATLKSP